MTLFVTCLVAFALALGGQAQALPLGDDVLRRGSQGQHVANLQLLLEAHGFQAGSTRGLFDAQTDQAVRLFQQQTGIQVDGVVGPQTRAALRSRAHQVRSGDTTFRIGSQAGVTTLRIIAANGLSPQGTIFPGQRLLLPLGQPRGVVRLPGSSSIPVGTHIHTVRRGDSVFMLAQHYATTTQAIASLNSLPDPRFILTGQNLLIPPGTGAQASLPPETSSQPQAASAPRRGSLEGKIIVLDPGHGAPWRGAVARSNGIREDDVVLDIARRLRTRLEAQGARVIMTRNDDNAPHRAGRWGEDPLPVIQSIARSSGGHLFLSIHNNAHPDPSVRGVIMFYAGQRNLVLARDLRDGVVARSPFGYGGSTGGTQERAFAVLRNHPLPAVLAEIGFLTNAQDAEHLARPEVRQQVADGLYDGIVRYLNR